MKQNPQFPRTMVGGRSLSRMIIGTNWFLGYSHTSPAADELIKARYRTPESFLDVLEAYLSYGVDTVMAPISANPHLMDALLLAEQRFEKKFIWVDTPILCVDDTAEGRAQAQAPVLQSLQSGKRKSPPPRRPGRRKGAASIF